MGKRVYELAKDLGVETRQIIYRLKEVGFTVEDHLSILTAEAEKKARELFATPRVGDVEVKRIRGGRVVRRRVSRGKPEPVKVEVEEIPEEERKPEQEEKPEVEAPSEEVEVAAVEAASVEEASVEGAEVEDKVEKEPAADAEKSEEKEAGEKAEEKKEAAKAAKPTGEAQTPEKKATPALKESDGEARKRKPKHLIYDRKRDVISLRDMMISSEDQPDRFKRRRPYRRRKPVRHHRGRKTMRTQVTMPSEQKRNIRIDGETIQVGEIAKRMGLKANALVKKLMEMGTMVSVNQVIDLDTAGVLASEYGFTVESIGFDPSEILDEAPDDEKSLRPRPPVVTIMGHVDHGKTTLLDRIRKTHVADGEAGGITQHIGAYKVFQPKGDIVFLDTPGHEAFTAMRARGAEVTDIVVLIVAADDGVKAQTREAISHARDSGAPIIVAINKIDKPDANLDRVRNDLAEFELVSEEWGGENIFCEISAKNGDGVDNLLDMILLQSQMMELKANPDKPGRGFVLEAKLDKRVGPLATVLVQSGTLGNGDVITAGLAHGHIRRMFDDGGDEVDEALPATPIQLIGLDIVPNAGDLFVVVQDEKKAKEIADWQMIEKKKARTAGAAPRVTLEDFYEMVQAGSTKNLKIILRTDVQGSMEALTENLGKLKHPEINLKVIHSAVGNITESDVNLAMASNAVIVGFNVTTNPAASAMANQEQVDVRRYSVIYEVVEDLRKAMEGLLEPKKELKLAGRGDVREVFKVSKIGNVAGVLMSSGRVQRDSEVHVVRGGETVFEGNLASLKHFKDDVKEVKQGLECGIAVEGFEDVEVGDQLEFYEVTTVRGTIELPA